MIVSEFHYSIPEPIFEQTLSPTAKKISQLDPKLLLGDSTLFNYSSETNALTPSKPFHKLLQLLVELDELDPEALKAGSLNDLNKILQQAQGSKGGLMRKEGTERWHLEDNPTKQKNRDAIETLFQELGFVLPKSLEESMTVDHCIIFGARVERMETRIAHTLGYLNKNLKVTGHVFLLGSVRKLVQGELDHLKKKIDTLDEAQKSYWSEVFADPEQATEANAFLFLWSLSAPSTIPFVAIKSTRHGLLSHRPTTDVTTEDWITYYKPGAPQTLFALAEKPYVRMCDQLRFTVLTNAKQEKLDGLVERIKNTTFHFASPKPTAAPLISVVLDEIGRNVYRTNDALKYLDALGS